jgi:hypothetical protein
MRVTKSGRVRWAGHVAHSKEIRDVYKILAGKHEGKRPLGRLTDGKIVLEWILGK